MPPGQDTETSARLPAPLGTSARWPFRRLRPPLSPGTEPRRRPRVLAQAVGQDDALVILMSSGWTQPDRVLCRRFEDGWVERGTTAGQTVWSSYDDDEDLGLHASWGRARPKATAVLVTLRGATIEVPVQNDHYVWLVERVPVEAMDEPIDFRWLP